jgi:riboflavin synthase alpha subunit
MSDMLGSPGPAQEVIVFTGRIREVGVVGDIGDTHIAVRAPKVASLLAVGGSVAVAGVCLTTREVGEEEFVAALSVETRRRSTLDELARWGLPTLAVADLVAWL